MIGGAEIRDVLLAVALIVGTLALAAVWAGAVSRRILDETHAHDTLRAAVIVCESDDPGFGASARDIVGHTLLPTAVERVRHLARDADLSEANRTALNRELDAAAAVAARLYRLTGTGATS